MNNNEQKKYLKHLSTIRNLLGVAALASTLAFLIWKMFSDKAYKQKWKDYDDCGLA